MKSVIRTTVAVVSLAIGLQAQADDSAGAKNETKMQAPGIKLIPELGVSSFTVTGTDLPDLGHRGAASIGVSAKMQTGMERVQVSGGIEYFEAGAKQDYFFAANEFENAYLGVALKTIYQISDPTTDGVHWSANVGLKPSYLVSAKLKTSSIFADSSAVDTKENINKFDLLLGAGFNAEYDWQGHIISLGLSYQKGTQKVFKDQNGSRNEGFVAQVGYVFAI